MNHWRERLSQRSYLRIGHRGAGGLEPQNTWRAFKRAMDLGVDGVELDVRKTADGQLVVVHDEGLAESTNGQGLVHERTLAELLRLDAGQGERILTLDEALDALAGKALIVVDLKIRDVEDGVVQAVAAHGVQDDVLVCSLLPASLLRVRALAPAILTAISYPEDRGGASNKPYLAAAVSGVLAVMRATLPWRIGGMMDEAQADATMLYYKLITPSVVEAVHRRGGLIGAWTVDTPDSIARMRAAGVDSITSNRPDLLDDERMSG